MRAYPPRQAVAERNHANRVAHLTRLLARTAPIPRRWCPCCDRLMSAAALPMHDLVFHTSGAP